MHRNRILFYLKNTIFCLFVFCCRDLLLLKKQIRIVSYLSQFRQRNKLIESLINKSIRLDIFYVENKAKIYEGRLKSSRNENKEQLILHPIMNVCYR